MTMRAPESIRREIQSRRTASRQARRSGNRADAWLNLEEAHILSQPWPGAHTRVHLDMLVLAVRSRAAHETMGQLFRIAVAGVGSAAGRYPAGNTGRANVSAFRPMPMPAHLGEILDRESAAP